MVSPRDDRWSPEREGDPGLKGDQPPRMGRPPPLSKIFSMICRERHQWPAMTVFKKYEVKEALERAI